MVGLALQHVDDAGAAEAFLAAAVEIEALGAQHLQGGFVGRHLIDRAGAGDFHLEAFVGTLGDVRVGGEELEMHRAVGPMRRGVGHRVHQAGRPAAKLVAM